MRKDRRKKIKMEKQVKQKDTDKCRRSRKGPGRVPLLSINYTGRKRRRKRS